MKNVTNYLIVIAILQCMGITGGYVRVSLCRKWCSRKARLSKEVMFGSFLKGSQELAR